ncbi:MAG TPA: beta-ketoacyl-ACP synthase II [Phycisphaerales bacterium]|nr:beta-ketoacyl-ACP synthase II [Phycisphaerales bacterium]
MSSSAGTSGAPRIVITGMGAITNLGLNAASTWSSMREGRSGITELAGEEFARHAGHWTVKIGGQIRGWDPVATGVCDTREARRTDRFSLLGVGAADEALRHSGLDLSKEDSERCGVIIGSGIGGIQTIEEGMWVLIERGPERISPFTVPRLMANAAAGNISIKYGLRGPASTHATACASSGHAIGDAMHVLRRGEADVMIVGGAEAACSALCIGSFMTMRALSTRNEDPTKASRPFDRARDGFVLAEGAAMFVLETEEHARKRGAVIYAELVGTANSSDASHITAPDSEGSGAARSMRWALRDAGLNAEQIEYVNAHGTSTPLGDKAEVAAVSRVFGEHARGPSKKLMMSSTKSMHGHCLGASGAVELIACIHAVRDGIIPPTINLESPDDEFAGLDLVPGTARERRVKYAMNNTFGFGGHNVTLVVGRYDG